VMFSIIHRHHGPKPLPDSNPGAQHASA
jgi:hypothetical protein